MKTSYPSDSFPAFPAVSVDAPADWEPIVVASSLLATRAPESSYFRPNVVVTLSRFGSTYELEEAILALKAENAALPESIETVDADVDVSGFAGHAHEVTYRHPELGALVQSTRITVIAQGSARDLVLSVGTCAGSRAAEDLLVLRGILRSLAVTVG
jgi:hypothetical protein